MNEQTLTNRIVGGLSYMAVLFLPVLFTLIVWIVARQDNPPLAHHGKVAFWTQLAPFLVVIALLVVVAILNAVGISASHHTITGGAAWLNILWVVALLVGSATLFAYNIVMAVLVFLGRR